MNLTAQEALDRLRRGNKRFAAADIKAPRRCEVTRNAVAPVQNPFAVILSCADSRVSPELVFDQGIGDLLVTRNAGNVVGADVSGTVEYGVVYLGARLVVSMGHEGCGAVTAALETEDVREKYPDNLKRLLRKIDPALEKLDSGEIARESSDREPSSSDSASEDEKRLSLAVEANVRNSVEQLRRVLGEIHENLQDYPGLVPVRDPEIRVVGAVYDLKTGIVRFLDA